MKPTETKLSIVFCHGIWADGSCFNKVTDGKSRCGDVSSQEIGYSTKPRRSHG